MIDAKYIIVEQDGFEMPYLFSPLVKHSEFAYKIGNKVISAGFISIGEFGINCYGKSDSLNIVSRGEKDVKAIKFMMRKF